MRKCDNCYDGHYNLSERGEELYCGLIEDKVEPSETCEDHRYIPGMEEDKNYLYYDKEFIAPGFLIVNMSGDVVNKFFKLYTLNRNGFPCFAICGYSKDFTEDPEEDFSPISFTFRDIEDDENGLYDIFTKFNNTLNNEKLYSIDLINHGKNHLEMISSSNTNTLILSRDNYYGDQFYNNYVNLILGDDYTCKNYQSVQGLFNDLKKQSEMVETIFDVKKLLLK